MPVTKGQILCFHSSEVLRVVRFIEMEGKRMVTWGRGWRGDGGLAFHGYSISVLEDEKRLEMDGGGACTTRKYLMPLNSTL